jgi:hypothetical protein
VAGAAAPAPALCTTRRASLARCAAASELLALLARRRAPCACAGPLAHLSPPLSASGGTPVSRSPAQQPGCCLHSAWQRPHPTLLQPPSPPPTPGPLALPPTRRAPPTWGTARSSTGRTARTAWSSSCTAATQSWSSCAAGAPQKVGSGAAAALARGPCHTPIRGPCHPPCAPATSPATPTPTPTHPTQLQPTLPHPHRHEHTLTHARTPASTPSCVPRRVSHTRLHPFNPPPPPPLAHTAAALAARRTPAGPAVAARARKRGVQSGAS